MSSIPKLPIWEQFFETLRDTPELWDMKAEAYKDRYKKLAGWENLFEVYKEIEPTSTIDGLKKRVNNIRTCYRRELKKVWQCETYQPQLWYFTALDFLRDQDERVPCTSSMYLEDETQEEYTEPVTLPEAPQVPPQKKRKSSHRELVITDKNDLLKEALRRMDPKIDDVSIYAESWAVSYRKLTPTQQLFAKKAIDDILILGQLEKLTLHTVSYDPPQVADMQKMVIVQDKNGKVQIMKAKDT